MEYTELLNKLKIISERASTQGNGYVSEFLNTIFDYSDQPPKDLLEYLYKSEFLESVSEMYISQCRQLITDKNVVQWLMIVESAFGLFEPEKYCDTIFDAYKNNLSPEEVGDVLEIGISSTDFTNNIAKLIRERKGNRCEPIIVSSKPESLNNKLLERRIRQLIEQNRVLKEINDAIFMEKQNLEEQFKSKSNAILKRDEYIGELEAQIYKLEQEFRSFENSSNVVSDSAPVDVLSEYPALDTENAVVVDKGEGDEMIIPIPDNYESFVKRNRLFFKVFANHFAKKFNKKPLQEQENLLFIKMMELRFDKAMVREVKEALRRNGGFPRLDIYKFISKNPSGEELTSFCNSIT